MKKKKKKQNKGTSEKDNLQSLESLPSPRGALYFSLFLR